MYVNPIFFLLPFLTVANFKVKRYTLGRFFTLLYYITAKRRVEENDEPT